MSSQKMFKGVALFFALVGTACAQDNLGLANGYLNFTTSNFQFSLVKDAQVLASLKPAGDSFDFLPSDLLKVRARNGQYHWGDVTFRYREEGGSTWTSADSSTSRKVVTANGASGDVLASSSLTNTLPTGPLTITREWLKVSEDIALRFTVKNTGTKAVEIGSLGFPAEFNSIFTNRLATDMQKLCSLSDPYVGLDAGYIRANPIRGTGKSLVVTPLSGSPLEGYRNLAETSYSETNYGSQTFEGFYEWQVLTKAYADNEWKGLEPWNPATSKTLKAGEEAKFGVRFSIAEEVRDIDNAVAKTGTPVAVGVPGFIVPRDLPAQLLLKSESAVSSITASPNGAFAIASAGDKKYTLTASSSAWGRVRVTIKYADGKTQTVHYFITKPTTDVLSDLGNFLTTEAYFNKTSDPFKRAPSVMTYDYEKRAIVEQDMRAWVAGLSDEGGTGAYVAALAKQALQPDAEEVAKLEDFVGSVIWGGVQSSDYSVKKAIFYYDKAAMPNYPYDTSINWGTWMSWNKQAASYIDRAYNYVHVAVAYWSLYRVARAYPTIVSKDWQWYLEHAQGTIIRMTKSDIWYNDVGLMGETVFAEILADLKREGQTSQANAVEAAMKVRATLWHSQEIPYGSEMAWDSTGQEGVYYWTKYFGFTDSVTKTINSVLGFMPAIAHWGWNGNARRYWDFIYGAKLGRIERQIHHYGSGLNSQVLLAAYRDDPSDSYLLRVGYGGSTGPLTNINQDGFPSAAFHSWPNTLKWDGITGDYGPGFLGMALGSGTYVADDENFGLVAYGGILSKGEGGSVVVEPRDAVRKRVFIGPLKLLVNIDAGSIEKFSYTEGGAVSFTVGQQEGAPHADNVVVWVESTGAQTWAATGLSESRGGWQVPLSGQSASFTLQVS
ncbi:unnamed protein product [Clonostachys byssicola]|uniref:Uncharacterized protein n=1 Tax=Clonostachys byssicola TaxID=160290 RepID=A0A9N9XZ09_9HYPO|nr:unnamed protein product [Clonostachys byssicola]